MCGIQRNQCLEVLGNQELTSVPHPPVRAQTAVAERLHGGSDSVMFSNHYEHLISSIK
jgi:hypothetical protein